MTGSKKECFLPINVKGKVQGAQAFHRAMTLLKLIANNNQKGMRLIDIAHLAGLTIPTTHRILQALVAERLLYKISGSNLYAIGTLVYELGSTARQHFNFLQMCTPIIKVLANKVSACALLSIKSDYDVVCMIKADSTYSIQSPLPYTGNRLPLGACASGVAILSALTRQVRDEIIQKNRAQLDLYYKDALIQISAICDEAKNTGYALIHDPLCSGMTGLAMPIVNDLGVCSASICVLLPYADAFECYEGIMLSLKNAVDDMKLLLNGKNSVWEL